MSKMKNKFNNNILFYSFIILLILVLIIYSSIMLYDNYKKQQIKDEISLLNQQTLLNDLYSSYVSDVNTTAQKCSILNNQFNYLLSVNAELYSKLKAINKNAIVETDNNVKYMYVLENIKLWLQYKKINKECKVNKKVALYFYPEINGWSVEKSQLDAKTMLFQGKLRDVLSKCGYSSISLPYITYIPIIKQMAIDYNITSSPSAFINNKIFYDIPVNPTTEFYKEIDCNIS